MAFNTITVARQCRQGHPPHHYKITVTATLRTTGPTAVAPFEAATNGGRFHFDVKGTPVQMLQLSDTVIIDNLNVHKVAGGCEPVEAAGERLLCLPTYSHAFTRPNAATTSPPQAMTPMIQRDRAKLQQKYRGPLTPRPGPAIER